VPSGTSYAINSPLEMAVLGRVLLLAVLSMSGLAATLPKTEPIWGYGFTNAFPGLSFTQPVMVVSPPGRTNQLFVVERAGRIQFIPDMAYQVAVSFLNLTNTWSQGEESGLLGLAFHPNFNQNGRLFVYRTIKRNGLRCELSEFRVSPENSYRADPASEKILISQLDDLDTHNAGDLRFGPDGYLYLSLGDERPAFGDLHDTPQAIDRGFFAGIIRIDVDGRAGNPRPNPHPAAVGNYWVPADNPFIGITEFNRLPVDPARVRTEFYAVGLRNPWRLAFDPVAHDLIAAEVGAAYAEEVNLIQKGGNYGWPYLEGDRVWNTNFTQRFKEPLYQFTHGVGNFEGRAIIGGVIAEDANLGELAGKYLFADFESGNVWALDTRARSSNAMWLTARRGLASFAVDPRDRGVLVANLISGKIEKLVYRAPEQLGIPRELSELGLFENLETLSPRAALTPYEIINPLWSDGAAKQRWVSLEQASEKIEFADAAPWKFPGGAFWVKHFELELTNGVPESRRRLETRVLVRGTNGTYGFSYRWGESRTNAILLPPYPTNETFLVNDGGTIRTQVWTYPGWEQCRTCHTELSGGALSFNTHQLNRTITTAAGETNQLAWLQARGFFKAGTEIHPGTLPSLSSMDDPDAPWQHKVRSYLFSNCSHCHQTGSQLLGPAWDARITTPLAQANVVNGSSFFYPPPMKLIAPHDETNSFLLERVSNRAMNFQMPPLATSEVDSTLVAALRNWIGSFPDDTWSFSNVGLTLAEGAGEQNGAVLRLASAARGLNSNGVFFAHRAASGTTELVGHISQMRAPGPESEAGLMFRSNLAPEDPFVAVFVKDGSILLRSRNSDGGENTTLAANAAAGWLKLIRSGDSVSAWTSANGRAWELVGVHEADLGQSFRAGLFAASVAPSVKFVSADFDVCSLTSVRLATTVPGQLPQPIALDATVAGISTTHLAVSYFADDELIATATNQPFSAVWTSARAGSVSLSAVLQSEYGSITSNPVALELEGPETAVWMMPADADTEGDWRAKYGRHSHLIPGWKTNNSPAATIEVLNAGRSVAISADDPMALEWENGRGFSLLPGNPEVEIAFEGNDFQPHTGSIYFHDWLGIGAEVVISFSTDGIEFDQAQTVNCETGVYVTFVFRGRVVVRVKNPRGTAHVSGVFVDPVEDISVEWVEPERDLVIQQPAEVVFEATARAPGRDVVQLEIRDRDKVIATFDSTPFRMTLTNLHTGEHVITAVARGAFGLSGVSAPRLVTVLPPETAVEFLGTDTTTRGSWKRRYGTAGFWTIGDAGIDPGNLRLTVTNEQPYVWASSTEDERGLERWAEEGRTAACLFGSPEFTLGLEVLDGSSTIVGFYFVDWDNGGRIMDIELHAPDGTLIEKRRLELFSSGTYWFWRVQGSVSFKFSAQSINPVLSGIFWERELTPYDLWRNNVFARDEVPDHGESFAQSDFDGDGFSNLLEYAVGFDARLADDAPTVAWTTDGPLLRGRLSRRVRRPDLEPIFELSNDLRDWSPLNPEETASETEDFRVTLPMTENRQFVRMRILQRR
jgi:glucose/arabinose dehydrogenase